ncbi:hypothetical protein BC829DRAFT_196558 [Chytridium lagenaria]|nr:hypothetical protein BC829DRAFT_196558 [Chytridium lagenaria]
MEARVRDTIVGRDMKRVLAGLHLLSLSSTRGTEGDFAVLDMRYKSLDDDTFHFSAIIVFEAGSSEWKIRENFCGNRIFES